MSIGSAQAMKRTFLHSGLSPTLSVTSKAKKNKVRMASSTGNFSWSSEGSNEDPGCPPNTPVFTGNLPDPLPPMRTSGKTRQVLTERDSRLVFFVNVGSKPFRRNSATDWREVRRLATIGELESVPDDLYIRYYSSLKRIGQDHCKPAFVDRTCTVFFGLTGTGKSHRAWSEAGVQAYSKDPLSKWWCGYTNQEHVIIDEFRGVISIAHILRWLDRYPVSVETKGGSRPLMAKRIWITSNVHPELWYPDLDQPTREALMRRLVIVEMNERYIPESE